MQAAILRLGLPRLGELNARRRAIARRYQEACAGGSVRVVTGAGCETVAHLSVVRTTDRAGLRKLMGERGIDTDIHYPVLDHRQPGLEPPVRVTDLHEAELAVGEIVTLPCFPELTDEEVGRIASAIADFDAVG